MAVKKRNSGVSAIGELPWGSHISIFYGTKEDLINTLAPYFKAGLEDNELCCLITPDIQTLQATPETIFQKVPDLLRCLATGQMIVLPHTEVYLKNDVFNRQNAVYKLEDIFEKALATGYDGFRAAADMSWLEGKNWELFNLYEIEANKSIKKFKFLALCAYPLATCGASQFSDVTNSHPYSYIVQKGEWLTLRPKTLKEMELHTASKVSGTLTPLQNRFAVSGLMDFTDEEIVELILSLCPYRNHMQKLPTLIRTFKNIRGLLSASSEELKKAGLDSRCIAFIRLLREIPTEVLKQKIKEKPVYDSAQEIFDFLYYTMRDLKNEVLKVIHLNSRNQIIEVIDLFEGISDKIAINAREVVESAIEHDAKSLIFVHNHPSGDPAPSKVDIQLTRDLVFVSNILQIRVLDHIIIGENRYASLAAEGLIEEFEMDFLNLRLKGTPRTKRKRTK